MSVAAGRPGLFCQGLRLFVSSPGLVIALLHLLILGKCYAVCINASHYNESVHRKKHYTRGNNTIPYKLARLVTFESLKWKYSFATNSTLFMKLGSLLYVRCHHSSVKNVQALLSNKKFLFQLANNADSYGIVNRIKISAFSDI